ncbi:VOC family protein [Marinibaculum pumilum]|uniref:VOC family protein n=1 Tax=Marinibaculum pumilum TaxID=1766165 RepID=A0ABV7L6U1_9PROT
MDRSALTVSLYVPDVAAAMAFYTGILGFTHSGSWNEDGRPIWAEVARDGPKGTARIWFFCHAVEDRPGPAFSGLIYLFVEDVRAEAERLDGRAKVRWGPEDQPYGLRELGVEDPHGYLLCFAQDI